MEDQTLDQTPTQYGYSTLPNNELCIKIVGKTGFSSRFSPYNFQAGDRGLTEKEILDLPDEPLLIVLQKELSVIRVDESEKTRFFPKQTQKGEYWKGLDPNDYDFVFGIKYRGDNNENEWYKACFINKIDKKYAFLTCTSSFISDNGLIESLYDGWYACRNAMMAPALFWSCVKAIVKNRRIA
jgi:hypothetical protein